MAAKRGNPNWVKGGQSPNPGGRPKAATELTQALAGLAVDAAVRLAELMDSADDKVALDATKFVIDHVKGKASQAITGADGAPLIPTNDELEDRLAALAAIGSLDDAESTGEPH
jgi:hypothetical protein